jgi:hypothetical protein
VSIDGPDPYSSFAPGALVTLQGSATDTEDGTLQGNRLRWSSSIDGELGTGETLQVQLSGPATPCDPEIVAHEITLEATDSGGNRVVTTIIIFVGVIC